MTCWCSVGMTVPGVGNEPQGDSRKGNHQLDGPSLGHSISHSLPIAPAIIRTSSSPETAEVNKLVGAQPGMRE